MERIPTPIFADARAVAARAATCSSTSSSTDGRGAARATTSG